jgi:hypothetical protein
MISGQGAEKDVQSLLGPVYGDGALRFAADLKQLWIAHPPRNGSSNRAFVFVGIE